MATQKKWPGAKAARRRERLIPAVIRSWESFPDWRDASAYPKPTAGGSLQWWGYEFLRRQDTFRNKLTARLNRATDQELEGLAPRTVAKWEGLPRAIMKDVLPPRPQLRDWPHGASTDDVNKPRPGYRALTFNLRLPIDEQLRRARAMLTLWQRASIKTGAIPAPVDKRIRDRELLPLFLRVLDAESAGDAAEKVAEHLSRELPETIDGDRVRKWLVAARRYRDHDYMLLLSRAGT